MTKLEEIARAIKDEMRKQDVLFEFDGDDDDPSTLMMNTGSAADLPRIARAVLSALKTPTPEMIEAGQAVDGTVSAADVWSAMIGAAGEGR